MVLPVLNIVSTTAYLWDVLSAGWMLVQKAASPGVSELGCVRQAALAAETDQ